MTTESEAKTLYNRLAVRYSSNDPATLIAYKVWQSFRTDENTWCQTCGSAVRARDRCSCWTHLADALQQYLGYDYDSAADVAANMWDALSNEDKERVRNAEYADTYDTETYDRPTPKLDATMAGVITVDRKAVRLDMWTVYSASGEYSYEARTLADAEQLFRNEHGCDDFVLAITCDGMEPPLAFAD